VCLALYVVLTALIFVARRARAGGKGDKKGGGDPAARRDKYRTIHDDPVPGPGAYVNSAPSSFRGGGKAAEATKRERTRAQSADRNARICS
jgi:hypothetical protein